MIFSNTRTSRAWCAHCGEYVTVIRLNGSEWRCVGCKSTDYVSDVDDEETA